MYYVYFPINKINNYRYIGHCKNIPSRLKDHNYGKVKSTKKFKPWYLVYYEEFKTRDEAIARERFFKIWNWSGMAGFTWHLSAGSLPAGRQGLQSRAQIVKRNYLKRNYINKAGEQYSNSYTYVLNNYAFFILK